MKKLYHEEMGVPVSHGDYVQLESISKGIVRLPVLKLDVPTANGRIYPKEEIEKSIKSPAFEQACKNGMLTCSADGHPQDVFPKPTDVSHRVTKAWVESHDGEYYLYNEWKLLNTDAGRNLRAVLEGGGAVGVSVRGLATSKQIERDGQKYDVMSEYEFLGTDAVSVPAANLWIGADVPHVQIESVQAESTQYLIDGKQLYPTGDTVKELPPGYYDVGESVRGLYFTARPNYAESLLEFDDPRYTAVAKNIKDFWESREKYEQAGIAYKRGLLLYGKPGTGKTALIEQIAQDAVKRGHIVLHIRNPYLAKQALAEVHDIEPERGRIVVFEEIDQSPSRPYLEVLDSSQESTVNTVFIGTTNYLEKLDPALVRTGRFDMRVEIGPPPKAGRQAYFSTHFGEDVDELVQLTDGLTFGELREVLVLTRVYGKSPKEAVAQVTGRELEMSKNEVIDQVAEESQYHNHGEWLRDVVAIMGSDAEVPADPSIDAEILDDSGEVVAYWDSATQTGYVNDGELDYEDEPDDDDGDADVSTESLSESEQISDLLDAAEDVLEESDDVDALLDQVVADAKSITQDQELLRGVEEWAAALRTGPSAILEQAEHAILEHPERIEQIIESTVARVQDLYGNQCDEELELWVSQFEEDDDLFQVPEWRTTPYSELNIKPRHAFYETAFETPEWRTTPYSELRIKQRKPTMLSTEPETESALAGVELDGLRTRLSRAQAYLEGMRLVADEARKLVRKQRPMIEQYQRHAPSEVKSAVFAVISKNGYLRNFEEELLEAKTPEQVYARAAKYSNIPYASKAVDFRYSTTNRETARERFIPKGFK